MSQDLSHYRLGEKIATGAFGEIYTGIDEDTGKRVAIKIEKKAHMSQLKYEYGIYKILHGSRVDYIPQVYGFGKMECNGEPANALVMELLGPSLEELFVYCGRKFEYKTVLMLGGLMLSRIEFIHYKHYIHRDIKPDNFVFGNDESNMHTLYLIDLGLVKQFRNPKTYTHINMRTGKSLTGTARYASLNTHQGYEQSRRDDLESMGYCLIYFLKGKLPWQGMPGKTKAEKYENIKKYKENISINELCSNLPPPILKFMMYVRHLGFEEMPNYLYLKDLFNEAMKENKFKYDYEFDWVIKMRSEGKDLRK
ncbi:putative casein kinase I like protein [Astathelohania contejeani]|uniref:non-specific serine/threonine protein kinase n=1 Tax=Astathelohania contejeani TaxID=164912 RepID=A0ABQ7I2Q9_9MICR|nr:putative casein kinase I like protein [Thelohania contejeani]